MNRIFKQASLLLVAPSIVVLSACSPTENAAISMPEHQVITCEDYATESMELGLLVNNVWNKHAASDAPEGSTRQCILKQQRDTRLVYGWLWDWPSSPREVFAQPQIKLGASPWDPRMSFGNDFPVQVSQVESAELSHQLSVISNGNYNVATTMWLTSTPIDSDSELTLDQRKDAIVAEFMVWTYYTPGQFKPGGKKLHTAIIGGLEWEVWYKEHWGDVSKRNDNSWRYITFRLSKPSLDIDIDLAELLDFALRRDAIDERWYIGDLELGTEVMGGQGFASLERFKFSLNVDQSGLK